VLPAKYRCMKCSFTWSGHRVLWDPDTGRGKKLPGYGMTECPQEKCKSIYVEWMNWERCRKALGRYWEHD
jgi:hypothetical protein